MLDHVASAGTSSDTSTVKEAARLGTPAISEYYFYPRVGLCVVSGINNVQVAGIDTKMVEMRPLDDISNKIRIPLGRFATSGVRPLASVEDFVAALEETGGRARGGGIWSRRAEAYRNKMGDTHPVVVAAILRDILGAKRGKQFEKETFDDGKFRKADVSFSEAELVEKALDLLSGELRYVTGMSVREGRSLFLRAALNPTFKVENIIMQNVAVPRMADGDFKNIFGISIADAKKGYIDDRMVTVALPPIAQNVSTRATAGVHIAAKKAEPRGSVTIRTTGKGSSRAVEVKEDLKDLYRGHLPYVGQTGVKWQAFTLAAGRLNPGQFNLLCRVYFRKKEYRDTYESIAAELKATPDAIQSAAESAMADLKRIAQGLGKRSLATIHLDAPVAGKAGGKVVVAPSQSPDVRAVQDAEQNKVPASGMMRAFFNKALTSLTADELSVLTRHDLRNQWQRLTLAEIARADNRTEEQVRDIRDAASAKLAAHYADSSSGVQRFTVLNPHVDPATKVKTPAAPRVPRVPRTGTTSREERQAQQVPVENRAVYNAEAPFAAYKGVMRGIFLRAANALTPEQLSVLSRHELRVSDSRMSIAAIAEADGRDIEETIAIRNEAAARLKDAYGPVGGRLVAYSAFKAFTKDVTPRARVERNAPAVSFHRGEPEPVKVDLATRIIDGKLLVSLLVPLDDLKGLSQFTFNVDMKRDDVNAPPQHVAVDGVLKRGRGVPSRPFTATSKVRQERKPS